MTIGSDCPTAKTQYATKTQARLAARAGRAKGSSSANAYRCLFCSTWHIGNRRLASRARR